MHEPKPPSTSGDLPLSTNPSTSLPFLGPFIHQEIAAMCFSNFARCAVKTGGRWAVILRLCALAFGQSPVPGAPIQIADSRLQQQVDALVKFGNLGPKLEDGYSRTAWSEAESAGMEYFRQAGEEMGLQARYDGVGNLFLRTKHGSRQVFQTGSHMDSVPHGGTFDGGAGIITGLEAIRALLLANAIPADKDVELVLWRGEESSPFQYAYKGSKAAFGDKFPDDILARRYEGRTLEESIRQRGFDPSWIKNNRATLAPQEIDALKGYLELHIEQAKKLEQDGDDIGIVTSIRGGIRFKVEVTGSFDHSGATPMGPQYRHDANLTLAHIQVDLEDLLGRYLARHFDLVETVGVVNSDKDLNAAYPRLYENALSKVSGFGYLFLDIRSNNQKQRDEFVDAAKATILATANRLNTKAVIIDLGSTPPTETMNAGLQAAIERATQALHYKYQFMASGAGHDAAVVASHASSQGKPIPAGMIFIPCRQGISHDSAEFADTIALRKGAEVLANSLRLLLNN
jgi:hydantoinase/carbamoylase family amidase